MIKRVRYSAEEREFAVQQMMPPFNRAIVELAKATGITTVTLRTWQAVARTEGKIVPGNKKQSERWSSSDKFNVVLETAPLSESELSAYCRRKGIFPVQVAQWRLACEQANGVQEKHQSDASQARHITKLEKALKEQEALLALQKKAEAIWGKPKQKEE